MDASTSLVVACLVAVAGCASGSDEAQRAILPLSSDSVAVSAILDIQWDSLSAAFDALSTQPYTEEQTLEVWNVVRRGEETGGPTEAPRATRRVRRSFVDDSLVATETIDSSGTLSSPWAARLVSPAATSAVPFAHWIDGEPPYRSPRRQEEFYFQQLSDTTLNGESRRRYRVVPREASGGLTLAEFTTNNEQQVVALRERRVESAPFFRQESELQVEKDRVVLDITIDPPARGPRRYRLERVILR